MIIIVEKAHVNHKRKWLIALIGLLIFMSVPMVAKADPAITSFIMDRTAINQGDYVTFTLRTTTNVNYVFTDVDGVRIQGTRQSTDSWELEVAPRSTQNITIVANITNSINNAAMVSIPITVNAPAVIATPPAGTLQGSPPITLAPVTTVRQQQQTQQPQLSSPPLTLPPIGTGQFTIYSITEVPAERTGYVHLNVVVSSNTFEVWVQFDHDRFRRGHELTQARTDTTRTFEVIFRPRDWAVQTVRVSANREYVATGATTRDFTLTLAQPAPVVLGRASIINVESNNRTVAPGSNATVTVTTNQDVNYVWLTDLAGTRFNATISSQSATRINWTVTFPPPRSGSARIYANTTNTATGAVTRSMHFTVQQPTALIDTATAHAEVTWNPWTNAWNQGNIRVTVTTNLTAERVWVNLPDGRIQQLSIQSTGTSTRTWTTDVTINWGWGPNWGWDTVTVHASSTTEQVSEASRSVSITGWNQGNFQQGWSGSSAQLDANTWVSGAHIGNHWATGTTGQITVNTNPNQYVSRVYVVIPWTGHQVSLLRTSADSNVWVANIDTAGWWGTGGWNANWWWSVSILGVRTDGTALPTVGGTWHHW